MTNLAFVSLFLVAIMVSTATGQGGIGSCCRKISNTQVHRESLKSYYKQDQSSCPIYAVVFITIKGKKLCSDPDLLWTQTSMAFLDGKNWQRQRLHRRR